MGEPSFQSPIPGELVVLDGATALSDESHLSRVIVYGDEVGLDVAYGQSRSVQGVLAAGVRPGQVMLIGEPAAIEQVMAHTGERDGPVIVDVTHGQGAMRLTGSVARAVMGRLCDVDLSDRMTPDGAVLSGYVAGVVCTVVRDDDDGVLSFLILVERSYGRYLAEAVRAAVDDVESESGLVSGPMA